MLDPVPKVGFVSLGCSKALVDSEQILTRLRAEGYEIAPGYADADLVVVNTCGFLESAIEESLEAIGEALAENGRVIVTGCLGARADVIRARHPEVLAVTGPHAVQEVMGEIHRHLPPTMDPFVALVPPQGIKLTPAHYAYLKISEGCNHKCSFCIIPDLRGALVSRSPGDVLAEAERLVEAGVQELLIVSQDTSAYGVDLRFRRDFWRGRPLRTHLTDLAAALGDLGVWVRLHYVYPYPHVDELLPLMVEGQILPYLDVPFQHASNKILKAMRRPAHGEDNLRRVREWRAVCPDLTLRSTFIVGFPGETEADFAELLTFIEQAGIDRAACFKYSPVAGARANALADPVPETLKDERYRRFMEAQECVSQRRLQTRIGTETYVLIDGHTEAGSVGRSPAEAPEVDGVIQLDEKLPVGSLVHARITGAGTHDLTADVVRSGSAPT